MNLFFRWISCIGLLLWLSPAQTSAEGLTFGVYTSDKPSEMYKKFRPILDYLEIKLKEKNINLEIDLRIFPSYQKGIEALTQGKCDFARFGPASYIIAKRKNPGIRLLVMEKKRGTNAFKGIFFVLDNSPIKSIKDLRDKTLAFGSKNSTIGYLVQTKLIENGIFAKDLKSFSHLGRHDKVLYAVAQGKFDAGAVKENTFNKHAQAKNLRKIDELIVPTKPWIVRSGIDPVLEETLKRVLINLKNQNVLKHLGQEGFLPAKNKDFDIIRAKMEQAQSFDKGSEPDGSSSPQAKD